MPRVYPTGIIVTGRELPPPQPPPDPCCQRTVGTYYPGHVEQAIPFALSAVKLSPAKWLVPFVIRRPRVAKVEQISSFGPCLLERVSISGSIYYDRANHEEDGRVLFAPMRILESDNALEVIVRVMPELFMFDLDNVPSSTDIEDEPLIDYAPDWNSEQSRGG